MRRCALGVLLALAVALAARDHAVALLPAGDASGWVERVFDGATRYRAETVDGVESLRADADSSASGLYLEREVDLSRYPLLRWRWRVHAPSASADERSRRGDDFAARVYAIAAHPLLFWKTRAVCYVWAAAEARGQQWRNPFTDNVQVIVLRSGAGSGGRWVDERRDVAADFRAAFGEAPSRVDAVGIMTDSDNAGGTATAWYADLEFVSR